MLTTKKQFLCLYPSRTKKDKTHKDFYLYLIIIGLQNYCFYLN